MKSRISKTFLKQVSKKANYTPKFNFSSAAAKEQDVKENISSKFHSIYVKELNRIKEANQQQVNREYSVSNNTPTEAFKHPYHSQRFPLYFSGRNMIRDVQEAIGEEPVSPHYESFTLSRRAPLLGGLFLAFTSWLEDLNVNSYYGKQASYEIYTLLIVLIGFNESRYIINRLPLPRLTWFYDAFHEHEFKQTILNWYDSCEETTHRHLAKTKEQIDYFLIHKEYSFVKKRLLTSFLENERLALTKHFNDRTLNMLNTVKQLENNNIKTEINKVAESALNKTLETINDSSKNQEILETSFESALDGLKTGLMEYKNDKVVPLFLKELKDLSDPLVKLTPDAENARYALTEEQKKQLVDMDKRAKQDYLAKEPEISSAIKNTEAYQNILNRIKSKVGH